MADFNLDRIRFRWKNVWTASTQYVKDDIVIYGSKTYVCLIGHESNPNDIYPDINAVVAGKPLPKWELMFDGYQWKGDWTSDTFYKIGDIVKWKGYIYICTLGHNSIVQLSQGPVANIENWTLVATTYNWLNNWTATIDPSPENPLGITQNYDLGDVVIYKGTTYICTEKHTAANSDTLGLEDDIGKWTEVTRSDNWESDWQTSYRYTRDDVVKYGGIIYRCAIPHTSAANETDGLELDIDNWTVVFEGIEYKGNWDIGIRYKKGDVVKSGGSLWIAAIHHTSTTSLREDQATWNLWVLGAEYDVVWDASTEYSTGDIVKYGGYSYRALENSLNSVPSVNGLLQDTGSWELVTQGYKFRGEWNSSDSYLTGDVIRNSGYLYRAITDNTSTFPDSDTNIWEVLVTGRQWRDTWADDTLYYLGDIVTYAGTLYICIQRHTGTESDSRPDLDIENTNENYWRVLLQGKETNVLTTIGDIRTHDGLSTARLAIGTPGNALKVNNSNGIDWDAFEEVPNVFYVSVDGFDGELNGRTLQAPFKTVKFACDYIYNNLGIYKVNLKRYEPTEGQLKTVLSEAILKESLGLLSSSAPNLSTALNVINPRTGVAYGDLNISAGIDSDDALTATEREFFDAEPGNTTEEALRFEELIDYLHSVASNFNGETVTIGSEAAPIVIDSFPNTTVMIKTGIYDEVLPIRVPRNCALVGDELRGTVIQPAAGYEASNMFYINNGTGIRNMTLQGLYGQLGEPNDYLTRRPNAGAFVSLDPGNGPDDQSVWIINKSCYVQNVTTFGTGCIGMKIDGSLHNGGNRSVTANDFTQVLSDGIGYWASNGGRSELVSVFTYFCHIGYLAEDGGILRATNGNNSYGTYGSVAEGVNNNEIPITAQVNNETNQALVEVVYTDGNEIVAFGYENAGKDYTTASTTFVGTGINGQATYDEFRNKAISNIRILGPNDSSIPGGLNYQYLLNNAQGGNSETIILAAADETGTPEKYIGMRIVIVSGTGVGQYGVITGYNEASKVAVISKEYNGTSGWENLDPGRPIEPTLDTTTRYSLEPRVIIDAPEVTIGLNSSKSWPTGFLAGKSLASIEWVSGTWVVTNTSGDAAYSIDGTNFVLSASDLSGTGLEVGGINLSVSDSTSAYFLCNGNSTVYKYTPGTDTWQNWSITNQNGLWQSVTINKDNNTILAVYTGGYASFTTSGGSQDTNSFVNVGGENWYSVAYGNNRYVAIKGDGTTAVSATGSTWTETTNAIDSQPVWLDIAYGNGRFVAIGSDNSNFPDYTPKAAYSYDGITWYTDDEHMLTLPSTYLSHIIYTNGEFLAFTNNGSTDHMIKSKDGWAWQWFSEDSAAYAFDNTTNFTAIGYSNIEIWTSVLNSTGVYEIESGAVAVARAVVESSRINRVQIYDPGENYVIDPAIVFFDPEATVDATYTVFVNDNVLPQPVWQDRGQGFVSTAVTITGDGVANKFQTGRTFHIKNVSRIPGPGANIVINGIDDVTYRLTKVIATSGTGPYNIDINISPSIGDNESPIHEESIIIREQYSQIRLTGHDFLDIGTGNTNSTRYPTLYLEGQDSLNEAQPFNETVDSGGGRVFYTSTDQDGNFRVGELFKVEQATGTVTVNADLFELNGLSELSLGGVVIGGSQVVIREFSKDGTFVANSNNAVPTQAAIIKYLESRISSGGSDALTNTLIAGQVRVSATNISTTSDNQINIPVLVNHSKGVDGDYLALQLFGI
jgi:hypothetical protein